MKNKRNKKSKTVKKDGGLFIKSNKPLTIMNIRFGLPE